MAMHAGVLVEGRPPDGCTPLTNPREETAGAIVVLDRGDCMFAEKARSTFLNFHLSDHILLLMCCQNALLQPETHPWWDAGAIAPGQAG